MEGYNMVRMVMLVIIVLGAGGTVWMRRRRGHAYTMPVSPEAPHETLAHQAFTHGNSCLAAGQFADAIAAFHQARALEPKHPHGAGRLAEVARRQHAASAGHSSISLQKLPRAVSHTRIDNTYQLRRYDGHTSLTP